VAKMVDVDSQLELTCLVCFSSAVSFSMAACRLLYCTKLSAFISNKAKTDKVVLWLAPQLLEAACRPRTRSPSQALGLLHPTSLRTTKC
jgi:hypothetical protein